MSQPHLCLDLRWLACTLLLPLLFVFAATRSIAQDTAADCVILPRVLPPVGIEIPADRSAAWLARIAELDAQLSKHRSNPVWPDVEVLVKACRYAIEFRELYQEKDFSKVDRVLKLAETRLQGMSEKPAWTTGKGLQVRGFQSKIDGSAQPVGLILPENIDQVSSSSTKEKLPLYVWLHGRGDKATDIHFICERLDKTGEVAPAGAITLHPFGRHCVGYKSAGSTDVMEAIDFACANYPVDQRRIVLIGFSMGGAGVWHLAARYTDRFVAASPGAGFAETARYQNLTPDKYPPKYEQMLWSVYDVPGYTRNLFNIPFVAYSGELDKQIQAARVMEEAFKAEGRELPHLIGPGMGHKYHPETLKELLGRLAEAAKQGKLDDPDSLTLQTKHLHFAKRAWIRVDGTQEQYADTRVDANRDESGVWHLKTRNVSRLELSSSPTPGGAKKLDVDGAMFDAPQLKNTLKLVRDGSNWRSVEAWPALRKHTGISGPIDDAFFSPFLIVTPTGSTPNAAVAAWAACEQRNMIERWRTLMRGEPRVKRDVDVTDEDMQKFHVVVWGDPSNNKLLARLLAEEKAKQLPLRWNEREIRLGPSAWDATKHAPVVIMPNPVALYRYLVINSGLTFRPAHDGTNSLQNPHLPDWAVVGLDEAPSTRSPGRIAAAGFFSDSWQADPKLTFTP